MKIKDGASLQGLDILMRPVLKHAAKIWRKHGQELVVTSGTDGQHSPASFHYYGLALDFRTRYFHRDVQIRIQKELQKVLNDYSGYCYYRNIESICKYQVVLESTHIHVECEIYGRNTQI